jgi:hypothetical protein
MIRFYSCLRSLVGLWCLRLLALIPTYNCCAFNLALTLTQICDAFLFSPFNSFMPVVPSYRRSHPQDTLLLSLYPSNCPCGKDFCKLKRTGVRWCQNVAKTCRYNQSNRTGFLKKKWFIFFESFLKRIEKTGLTVMSYMLLCICGHKQFIYVILNHTLHLRI